MLQLSAEEKTEVVAYCDHLARLKFSPVFPYAFTKHGAIMVASVLNIPRAIEASVFVVRAFVKLREMISTHSELARKLAAFEQRLEGHDERFEEVFEAIRQLMTPPDGPRKKIGFEVKEPRAKYGRLRRGTGK
jgi:hypothetical protein